MNEAVETVLNTDSSLELESRWMWEYLMIVLKVLWEPMISRYLACFSLLYSFLFCDAADTVLGRSWRFWAAALISARCFRTISGIENRNKELSKAVFICSWVIWLRAYNISRWWKEENQKKKKYSDYNWRQNEWVKKCRLLMMMKEKVWRGKAGWQPQRCKTESDCEWQKNERKFR